MNFNDYNYPLKTLSDNNSAWEEAFKEVYNKFKDDVFKTLTAIGQHPNREFLFAAAWAKYPRSWEKIFKDLEEFSKILDRLFQAVDKDQMLALSAELVNKAQVQQELNLDTRSFANAVRELKNEQALIQQANQLVMEAELDQAMLDMDAWGHSDNLDSWRDSEGYNNPWRDSKMGLPHPLTRIYSPWRDSDETE